MAKNKISNGELAWIFTEKLKSFRDCAPAVSIAIAPTKMAGPYSEPERQQPLSSLREAYRAGSEGASRDLRSAEGLSVSLKGK